MLLSYGWDLGLTCLVLREAIIWRILVHVGLNNETISSAIWCGGGDSKVREQEEAAKALEKSLDSTPVERVRGTTWDTRL